MDYAKHFLERDENCSVMVICYYYDQALHMKRKMKNFMKEKDLIIGTVDGFQGRQADYVILSTCAQQMDTEKHLSVTGRVCVAISRCKEKLIILGKKQILASVDLWNTILQDVVQVEGRTCSPALML